VAIATADGTPAVDVTVAADAASTVDIVRTTVAGVAAFCSTTVASAGHHVLAAKTTLDAVEAATRVVHQGTASPACISVAATSTVDGIAVAIAAAPPVAGTSPAAAAVVHVVAEAMMAVPTGTASAVVAMNALPEAVVAGTADAVVASDALVDAPGEGTAAAVVVGVCLGAATESQLPHGIGSAGTVAVSSSVVSDVSASTVAAEAVVADTTAAVQTITTTMTDHLVAVTPVAIDRSVASAALGTVKPAATTVPPVCPIAATTMCEPVPTTIGLDGSLRHVGLDGGLGREVESRSVENLLGRSFLSELGLGIEVVRGSRKCNAASDSDDRPRFHGNCL